ncbi:hypothetical protein JCM17961_06830 [Endothiovibrio diazotrophicus]
MKLEKVIGAAFVVGTLLPALVAAQGSGGWYDDQGRWANEGTGPRYTAGGFYSTDDARANREYPSTSSWNATDFDRGYGAYPVTEGYPSGTHGYSQPTSPAPGGGTDYRSYSSSSSDGGGFPVVRTADGNASSYPQYTPTTDWGAGTSNDVYGGAGASYGGGYPSSTADDWGRSSYPLDGNAAQPYSPAAGGETYPRPPSAKRYSAPGTGYGAPSTRSYGENWAGGAASGGTNYRGERYSSGGYSDSWGGAGRYGGEGSYYPPSSSSPESRGNPWAGTADGYSREPAEDYRDQRRKENPWAFDRPDPARQAERRRWREVAPRPWGGEAESRREEPPPQELPYGLPYRRYGDNGFPGYGSADRYYPGGNWNPWSVWGGGMPGGNWPSGSWPNGNWGSWPYMPWSW